MRLKIGIFFPSTVVLDLPSKTNFGTWGIVEYCPSGSYAKRANIKVEGWARSGDDTGVNAIRLDCFTKSGIKTATIKSSEQRHGSWQTDRTCSDGFIKGARTKSTPDQGSSGAFQQNKAGHTANPL